MFVHAVVEDKGVALCKLQSIQASFNANSLNHVYSVRIREDFKFSRLLILTSEMLDYLFHSGSRILKLLDFRIIFHPFQIIKCLPPTSISVLEID